MHSVSVVLTAWAVITREVDWGDNQVVIRRFRQVYWDVTDTWPIPLHNHEVRAPALASLRALVREGCSFLWGIEGIINEREVE